VKRVDPRLLLAAACGGALGAVLRYLAGQAFPDGSGFPWTTFAINVAGSCLLALLPLLALVRRHRPVAVALGPGLLGGFTTLSAYAEQGRALLADDELLLAGSYLVGTLAACLVAVTLVARWVPAAGAEQ
jgi:CrcB protein